MMKRHAHSPLVIAHRGASGYLPEHTLEAVTMAHALGTDFIEQDLVLTKDGVPIVLHDIYLDTISDVATKFPSRKRADGRYYALDLTLAELKTLNASERFDPKTGKAVFPGRFPAHSGSFRIPTLEEEIQLIQGLNRSTGRNVGIYPELKNPAWHRQQGYDLTKAVLPLLQRYGYSQKSDACFVQCFELGEVKRLRTELGWKGRVILLLDSIAKGDDGTEFSRLQRPAGLTELAKLVEGIGPGLGSVLDIQGRPTELVKNAHSAGLLVHPYTHRVDALPRSVSSSDELLGKLFTEAKVDGLFSDFCDRVVHYLAKTR